MKWMPSIRIKGRSVDIESSSDSLGLNDLEEAGLIGLMMFEAARIEVSSSIVNVDARCPSGGQAPDTGDSTLSGIFDFFSFGASSLDESGNVYSKSSISGAAVFDSDFVGDGTECVNPALVTTTEIS
jgi:hypothetical protein